MNTYLKKELFDKVLLAQAKNTQYRFSLEMDDHSFRIRVHASHTPTSSRTGYTIAEYTSFMQNDPQAEEKELNYAIAEMNYFLRDAKLKNGIRLSMYMDFLEQCKMGNKPTGWIADFLNLDAELMKRVSA